MEKDILFLITQPLNTRNYERFGMKEMEKLGYKVYIWDLTFIDHPFYHNQRDTSGEIPHNNLTIFNNKENLFKNLYSLEKGKYLVISYLKLSYKTVSFYRYLSNNFIFGVYPFGLMPAEKQRQSFFKKINNKQKNLFNQKLSISDLFLKFLLKFLNNKLLLIKDCNFYISSGSALKSNRLIGKKSKIVPACTNDYNNHLKKRNYPKIINTNYVLFLDEFLPFHSDYLMEGISKLPNPSYYYYHLENFFKLVKNKTNLEIVVAAHPKSDYENYPEYFKNQKIIKGKTDVLVRDSNFVICHGSASISYAIIYKKPIILTTMQSLESSLPRTYYDYKALSKSISKEQLTLDNINLENVDLNKYLSIDQKVYKTYLHKYIKNKDAKNLNSWEILNEYIKNQN